MASKRVYFIGSGPSTSMGVPSVYDLYSEIISEKSRRDETFKLENIVNLIFPNLPNDKINFEELLTVLDVDGIGAEIFKLQRIGGDDFLSLKTSISEAYRILLNNVWNILYNQMGNTEDWVWFAKNSIQTYNDPLRQEAFLNEKRKLEPIKKAWANQYKKIIPSNDGDESYVITTNYDVLIEKQLERKYCYTNPSVDKVLIMKLHGSINWEQLSAENFPEKENLENYEILSFRKETRIVASPVEVFGKNAGMIQNLSPVFVPPMAQKRYEEPLFRQMFWQASNVLLKANELVILGYGFSDYDFYIKKLIDYAINSESSLIKNIYHYDLDEGVGKRLKSFVRKKGIKLEFVPIDFRKEVPDFKNIGNKIKIADV